MTRPDVGRILVADDDAQIRDSLGRMLRTQGHEVFYAADGTEALVSIEKHDVDLVLLDVVMPEMDGFEVCRQLRLDPDTQLLPVVIITGLSDVQDRIAGINAGADDFLSKPFEITELLARVASLLRMKRHIDELERAEAVVCTLARAIEGRDPYTSGHCERLSRMGAALGHRLGLPDEEIRALHLGGIVHDIGKISVPDAILGKDGALGEEERAIMNGHPAAGEAICQPLRSFQSVLPVVRSHHERVDGSGYPDGLEGDGIPVTARVLSIVDVYDALTTTRPYRKASPPDEALRIMTEEVERGWWDPRIFTEFKEVLAAG